MAKVEHEQEQLLTAAATAAAPAASSPAPEQGLPTTPVTGVGVPSTSMDAHQKLAQQLGQAQAPFALIQSESLCQ